MKKLTKVLVLLVLALGIGYGANAQTQKIGYVDSQAIIELMPESAKIQQDLQAYYSELQAELQAMATEYVPSFTTSLVAEVGTYLNVR